MTKSQYKSFFLPADDTTDSSELLNRFLRAHSIQSVEKQFVTSPSPGWAFCVVFTQAAREDQKTSGGVASGAKKDYRALLSPAEQLTYDHLRDLRTQLAKDDGKKAYNVFSNLQLYYMIQHRVSSLEQLRQVPDWGESRSQQYGEQIVALLQKTLPPLEST